MISYRSPIVAREGWLIISLFGAISLYLTVSHHTLVALFSWCVTAVVAWYFRDPRRIVPASPLAVVAPVDGVITAIENSDDKLVGREALRVVMRKSWHSVMTLRSPMEGKIQKQWNGSSLSDGGNETANQFGQWVQSDEGDDVCVTLTPLSRIRFFRCYLHAGERIGQGQRCGIYPLQALVEVKLPRNSHLHVKVGDQVKAGSDKLATLIH